MINVRVPTTSVACHDAARAEKDDVWASLSTDAINAPLSFLKSFEEGVRY
jgi:hypothetical protein